MGTINPRPTGQLQGDDRAMPDRGTRTGMNGDAYGADLSPSATNRQGRIDAQSHPRDLCAGENNSNGAAKKGAC